MGVEHTFSATSRPRRARILTKIGATGLVFCKEARWHGFERFRPTVASVRIENTSSGNLFQKFLLVETCQKNLPEEIATRNFQKKFPEEVFSSRTDQKIGRNRWKPCQRASSQRAMPVAPIFVKIRALWGRFVAKHDRHASLGLCSPVPRQDLRITNFSNSKHW